MKCITRRIILFCVFIVFSFKIFAQNEINFVKKEISAAPLVGVDKFETYIINYCENNYPKRDIRKRNTGEALVEFIVEKDSTLSNIRIADGHGINKSLNKVAIQSVLSCPYKWIPGSVDGKIARQIFQIPIRFYLEESK